MVGDRGCCKESSEVVNEACPAVAGRTCLWDVDLVGPMKERRLKGSQALQMTLGIVELSMDRCIRIMYFFSFFPLTVISKMYVSEKNNKISRVLTNLMGFLLFFFSFLFS